jgi:hypothetical protein
MESPGSLRLGLRAFGVLLALTTVVNAVGFVASAVSLDPDQRVPLGFAGLLAVGLAWAASARGRRAAIARGLLVALALGAATWGVLIAWEQVGPEVGEALHLPVWLAGASSTGQYDQLFGASSIGSSYLISWAPLTFPVVVVLVSLLGAAVATAGQALRQGASGGAAVWLRLLVLAPFAYLVRGAVADDEVGVAVVAVLSGLWLDRMVMLRADDSSASSEPQPGPA